MRPTRTCLALATSSAALLLAPGAQAALPGANGVLGASYDEFGRGGDQFYGLQLIRPGGKLVRKFSMCKNVEGDENFAPCPHEAAFSPDGSRVAYRLDEHLVVADTDGGNRRRLPPVTTTDSQPAWSPDGSTLVFTGEPNPSDFSTDLYVVGADGKDSRRLTFGGGRDPAWSSRGTIAFARGGEYSPREVGSVSRGGTIYILNPRTGSERPLAAGDNPDFSPSGRSIVYSRTSKRENIYRVEVSGEPRRRLLVRDAKTPVFSPDGRRLAFVQNASLLVANRDGTRRRVVRRAVERAIGSQFLEWNHVAWQPLPRR